jgi:hypothetical protein
LQRHKNIVTLFKQLVKNRFQTIEVNRENVMSNYIKTILLIFIATSISIIAFGQKDLIVISGKYHDSREHLNKIEAMNVWLTLNDSLIIESLPDSLGQFSFTISRNIFKTYRIELRVFQDQKLLDKIHPINDCPYLRKIPSYFNSKLIKEPANDIDQIIVDVELSQIIIEYSFPYVGFKKNSVEFSNCGADNSDTSLFCLRNCLVENPTLIIKISVHSWNETQRIIDRKRKVHFK